MNERIVKEQRLRKDRRGLGMGGRRG